MCGTNPSRAAEKKYVQVEQVEQVRRALSFFPLEHLVERFVEYLGDAEGSLEGG